MKYYFLETVAEDSNSKVATFDPVNGVYVVVQKYWYGHLTCIGPEWAMSAWEQDL